MPESFDAFYARTVWYVTNQMHELSGNDSAADHAIREAYARAYQQWYEVSGYPDTQAWVLAAAREAYARRRPEIAAAFGDATPGVPGQLAQPPMTQPPVTQPPVTQPAATLGLATAENDATRTAQQPVLYPSAAQPPAAQPRAAQPPAAQPRAAQPPAAQPPAAQPPAIYPPAVQPQAPHLPALRPRGNRGGGPRRGQIRWRRPDLSRRSLLTLAVVVAVIVGLASYFAVASQGSEHRSTGQHGRASSTGPTVHMLPAGQTGTRAMIPWSLVGDGWTLAELSTAPPDADGHPAGAGQLTTYLVDPQGGKYKVTATSAAPAPQLVAWSGDGRNALYELPADSATGSPTYGLLSLTSGQSSPLKFPAGVSPMGFTRPDGLNILAVRAMSAKFRLERYNLQGKFQAAIGTMPRAADSPDWQASACQTACGALSSPDGLTAVWGMTGSQMQLVSNAAGGGPARKLAVPDSGQTPSCVPLSWWNATTVLAFCSVSGQPYPVGRLWLVPVGGGTPTALSGISGDASGAGALVGAWQSGPVSYVTATDARHCPTATAGTLGLGLFRVQGGGALQPVTVPDSTGNHASVIEIAAGRLLLLAQTSCPGTSSLLWLSPANGAVTTLLTAPATQVGVIAAVPYGNGPAVLTAGQRAGS